MLRAEGQGEVKRGALAGVRVHPDTSAMLFHDFLAERQADPGAGIVGGRMQTLKDDEDTVGILRIDPDTVIPHGEEPFVLVSRGG